MHIKLISSSSNFESHPCQLKNTENKHQHAVTKLRLKLHFRGCHLKSSRKCRCPYTALLCSFQNINDRDVHADFYKYH